MMTQNTRKKISLDGLMNSKMSSKNDVKNNDKESYVVNNIHQLDTVKMSKKSVEGVETPMTFTKDRKDLGSIGFTRNEINEKFSRSLSGPDEVEETPRTLIRGITTDNEESGFPIPAPPSGKHVSHPSDIVTQQSAMDTSITPANSGRSRADVNDTTIKPLHTRDSVASIETPRLNTGFNETPRGWIRGFLAHAPKRESFPTVEKLPPSHQDSEAEPHGSLMKNTDRVEEDIKEQDEETFVYDYAENNASDGDDEDDAAGFFVSTTSVEEAAKINSATLPSRIANRHQDIGVIDTSKGNLFRQLEDSLSQFEHTTPGRKRQRIPMVTPLPKSGERASKTQATPSVLPPTSLLDSSAVKPRPLARKTNDNIVLAPLLPIKRLTKKKKTRPSGSENQEVVLPRSQVKSLWANILSAQGAIPSSDSVDAVITASQEFFRQVSEDLEAYATHASRSCVEIADAELLMKRQRLVNKENTFSSVLRKLLSREDAESVLR